jgi:hypothetical protein
MEVFKLQRALFPPDADVLAYDKWRRHQVTLPMSDELRRLFGDRVKVYCEAEPNGQGLTIGKRVADRGW